MSCALTTSVPLECRDAVGGIKSVRFATLASWQGLAATVASGEVTGFGSASGVFYTYEALKESSNFSDNIAGAMSAGTLFYTPTLELVIPKLRASVAREVLLLGKNRLVAIVESNMSGEFYVLGDKNGIELVSGTGASGTAFGDLNGYTIQFEGREPEPYLHISQSLVNSVTV